MVGDGHLMNVDIYVISIIGVILSIRYDGGKDPNVTSLCKYYK